ncbi:MAG: hypothetical protein J6Z36_03960, partial [Clostridia bacterium]|nr:hypothetical protein [Clostridia bacterium]
MSFFLFYLQERLADVPALSLDYSLLGIALFLLVLRFFIPKNAETALISGFIFFTIAVQILRSSGEWEYAVVSACLFFAVFCLFFALPKISGGEKKRETAVEEQTITPPREVLTALPKTTPVTEERIPMSAMSVVNEDVKLEYALELLTKLQAKKLNQADRLETDVMRETLGVYRVKGK